MGSGCSASVAPVELLESPSADKHLALLQAEFPFQAYIEKTEHRGITIGQLQRVFDFAKTHCRAWHDTAPEAYSKTAGQTLSTKIMNLYHLNTWLIMPATKERDCAMVELLATAPQTPKWFVSHWWGEALKDFLLCARTHAVLRKSTEEDPFWVCAHANRQHSLAAEVVADPRQTSFYKALQLARGVLLILDTSTPFGGPATPFTRIWCAFEEHVALTADGRQAPLLLDIATCHRGVGHALTDGPAEADDKLDGFGSEEDCLEAQNKREASFPEEVLAKGLTVTLETAEASVETDRVHILNAIAEAPDLDGAPPAEHPNYQLVNRSLRCKFALAAWPAALRRGKVQKMGLPEVLKADTEIAELKYSFKGNKALNDQSLQDFVGSFPPQLQRVSLDLTACARLTGAGAKNLGVAMGGLRQLASASFDMHGITSIGSPGWKDLGVGLAGAPLLRELELSGTMDSSALKDFALGFSTAPSLHSLSLHVRGSNKHAIGYEGVRGLADAVAAMGQLTHLLLSLAGCQSVGDESATALASGMAGLQHLVKLDVILRACPVGDEGAIALVDCLSGLKSLRYATLQMNGTAIGDAGKKKLFMGCPNLTGPGAVYSALYDEPSDKALPAKWRAEREALADQVAGQPS